MTKPVRIGDVCKYGHTITGANVAVRPIRGRTVIRCATCLANTAKRYSSTEHGKAANAKKERKRRRSPGFREKHNEYVRLYRANKQALEEGDVAKYDDKKTAPHNLLKPRDSAMPIWLEFQAELDKQRTPCFERPGDYMDFDDPEFPEEATGKPLPTAQEAAELCAPCPLKFLCAEFGKTQREDWGIWGGLRMTRGKVYTGA